MWNKLKLKWRKQIRFCQIQSPSEQGNGYDVTEKPVQAFFSIRIIDSV